MNTRPAQDLCPWSHDVGSADAAELPPVSLCQDGVVGEVRSADLVLPPRPAAEVVAPRIFATAFLLHWMGLLAPVVLLLAAGAAIWALWRLAVRAPAVRRGLRRLFAWLERLSDLFVRRAVPEHIRSENGAEFTSKAVREWLWRLDVRTPCIEPGNP